MSQNIAPFINQTICSDYLVTGNNKDDDDSASSNYSGLWSDVPAEEIKIGDNINYWLAIHVWGDDTTMRCVEEHHGGGNNYPC